MGYHGYGCSTVFFDFLLQDFLEDLWSRVQDLSNNGWKLDSGNGALFFMNFSFLGWKNDVYLLSLSLSFL